ncbi:MAG: rhodanese-like domain-containing protein [Nitrospirota bacterium]|nr:rhodanese-like domain-containing protein [Nitrospirota bacterium]
MKETVRPDELEQLLAGEKPPLLLDVRRRSDIESDPAMIPGAQWKDPEKVAVWGRDLGTYDVVIYCVRGGSVSRTVQEKLREMNISSQFIEGGIDAWKQAGKGMQKP